MLLANIKDYGYFKNIYIYCISCVSKIVFDNSTGTCRYGYQVLIYVYLEVPFQQSNTKQQQQQQTASYVYNKVKASINS